MPIEPLALSRRSLLRTSAAVTAGIVAGPALISLLETPAQAALSSAFIDNYQTNVTANLTVDTNAAVRALSGFQRIWQTGTAWNTGTVLDAAVLHASMRHSVKVTRKRTDAQAKRAFIYDRQHQSYAVIQGLGPLADAYKAGALAVTGITSAPDSTPATTINDTIPADAPAGSALGAGSPASALGQVVTLVNTLRGNYSSGNPSKYAYQYPRPWRMTEDSTVVDTGVLDAYGYPVYDSPVKVAPQLLLQRSTSPTDDAGFPSGHTNAFHLAAIALAYAVPQRFQELVATAYDLADTRIVAGMHSAVDVIGGRTLAIALAAAILSDPANAALKAAALAQAQAYFGSALDDVGSTPAERSASAAMIENNFAYGLPRTQPHVDVTVPAGAEVLLETRQPYLSADQRREVLRTTAFGSGYPLLDGPEHWGRLNLFAAADGYGAFDQNVTVTLDTADTWRNDIDGRGTLVKKGSGTLTLTGDNSYRGGTTIAAGTLTAGSASALGRGDVQVTGGTLAVASTLRVRGGLRVTGGTIAVTAGACRDALIHADDEIVLGAGATLAVSGTGHAPFTVLTGRKITGKFASVTVPAGYKASVSYSRSAVTVQLIKH